jgi:hypothetical protein
MYNFKRQGYKLLFESKTYNTHVYHLLCPLLSLMHLYQLRILLHLLMWVLVPVWTEAQPNICSKAHKDYGMDLRQDRTKIMTPGRDLDPSVRIQGHPLIVCS